MRKLSHATLALAVLLGCHGDFTYAGGSDGLTDEPTSDDLPGDDGGTEDDGGSEDGGLDDGGSSGNLGTSGDDGGETSGPGDDGGSSDGETSGPGSETTDTETSDVLGPGDPCHPLSHEIDDVPDCPAPLSCFYQGWDVDHWTWTCQTKVAEGSWMDSCLANTNSCSEGFRCFNNSPTSFTEGDCAEDSCCTPYCDMLNDDCPPGYECNGTTSHSDYPPSFQDTPIPFVGWCLVTRP